MNKSEEIRRTVEAMGSPEEVAESLRGFTQDAEFVLEHWAELLKQYPDKWIAVLQEQVIASADTLQKLLDSLPESDRASAHIDLIKTNPTPFIL